MTDVNLTETITIRFSRCAPPTLQERLRDRTLIDYSDLICRLTHSPFSHVDLLVDLTSWGKTGVGLLGSSNNPNAPYVFGNPAGVAVRPIDYQRFSIRRDAVIPVTFEQKQAVEGFCIDQLGKPFDRTALTPGTFLSNKFNDRDWRSDARWYCAEMIGRSIEVGNVLGYPYPGVKDRMSAADLLIWLAPKLNFQKFWAVIPHLPVAGDWES